MKKTTITRLSIIAMGLTLSAALAAPPPGRGGGGGGGGGKDKGAKLDHKARQATPIQLGTSGGWAYDLANGYCCAGTLGALVEDADGQYILSNFHVLTADVVSGGNGRIVQIGDSVIQPGLIDVGCDANQAQVVATIDGYGDPLAGANIDAAIAAVLPGMVDPSGAILGIGTLSSATVAAYPGQGVKKSGRTTGLKSSTVDSLNATVSVSYETECAGTARGTATFTGQIIVRNRRSKFLAGGDSGSLMVENADTNPRAVGLLFAGSRSLAVANPIDEVLTKLGVSMVGGAAAAADEAPALDPVNPAIGRAIAIQKQNARLLAGAPHGVGHAVGLGNGNAPIIKVFVEKDPAAARKALPATLGGLHVVVQETGRFVAL
jgi:hypothetical protein